MRRRLLLGTATALLFSSAALTTVAVASAPPDTTPPVAAAGSTPADSSIVGTWTLTDTNDPESTPFTGAFLSDGVYIEVDSGSFSIGVWEATGPNTVAMSYTGRDEDGTAIIRASITVDGDNATADYTLEFIGEGAPEGQYGLGQVTGTRDVVDPVGTPVGTLDELFASFSDDTGSAPPTSGV